MPVPIGQLTPVPDWCDLALVVSRRCGWRRREATQCSSTNAADQCEKHVVRISTTYMGAYGTTRHRNLLLHETGHALGLLHCDVTSDVMYRQPNSTTVFPITTKAISDF